MKSRFVFASLIVTSAALLGVSSDARACGGCFVPPSENTVVTGHRMALAVSPVQTVLWDQIQYSGDPEGFAWVLPVKPGAVIEVASDAWFETLEAATTTQVFAPPVNCGFSGSGCGFGASAEDAAFGGREGEQGPPVQVLHEGTVGPYETVTLATDTEGALNDWLEANGYSVDDSTQPVIDAYVEEGFDFIALRLQPNTGTSQMKPVRITTPGASPTLPLRMVAAGTGAQVPIVLFVIGEGRWQPANFPAAPIPIDLLAWDFGANESNYAELRQKVLAGEGGRRWLTAVAQQNLLFGTIGNAFTATPDRFQDLYAAQALSNGEIDEACTLPDYSNEMREVVDPCPPGVPDGDPQCTNPISGVSASTLACGSLDDLAVALTGMHPRDVWVTRLEADLPRAALDTDLELEAASGQEPVSRFMTARVAIGAEDSCPSGTLPVTPEDAQRLRLFGLAATMAALLAAVARRQARRFESLAA
ncbi:MAG: DUF2330 domain-containing protein [Polyangiaceae bacterium]